MDMRLLFNDIKFKDYLEKVIPPLFEEARNINTNDDKTNMAVGRDREDIIKIAFQRWTSKYYNFNCEISIPEELNYDSIFFNKKVQIKTKTTKKNETGTFKLNWASGLDNAELFQSNFKIDTDILYVRISKNKDLKFEKLIFCYINEEIQNEILRLKGIEGYFNIKEKDSKGIKINTRALKKMLNHEKTLKFTIPYDLNNHSFDYKNRIEFWKHRHDEYEKFTQTPPNWICTFP